uniref:Uncharacterized protein LOC114342098 n=1 Tax=Diabrotica virgifera virgifera TaxID=50390 RepID=A0A6P7GTK5_DIAVI
MNKELQELQELSRSTETRKFYQKLNKSRKDFKPRTTMCRDKEVSLVYLAIAAPFIFPIETVIHPVTNVTYYQRPLPTQCWLPFDGIVYYKTAFFVEALTLILVANMTFAMDIFFFSTLTYILEQLRILRLLLNHFEKYTKNIEVQILCTSNTADIVTLQLFIVEHQRIMRFINDFNQQMRSMMLIDFLQSSLQFGVFAVFMLCELENDYATSAIISSFIVTWAAILTTFYWYGSEVTAEVR